MKARVIHRPWHKHAYVVQQLTPMAIAGLDEWISIEAFEDEPSARLCAEQLIEGEKVIAIYGE